MQDVTARLLPRDALNLLAKLRVVTPIQSIVALDATVLGCATAGLDVQDVTYLYHFDWTFGWQQQTFIVI